MPSDPIDPLVRLLSSDIQDPIDFPSSAPGLRELDGAVRCDICGELFDAPVTLTCGHCFCSPCVRVAIQNKPECPKCRKQASETHLRVNPSMEEAVDAWKKARKLILRISREEDVRLNRAKHPNSVRSSSPKKRKRSSDSGSTSVVAHEQIAGTFKATAGQTNYNGKTVDRDINDGSASPHPEQIPDNSLVNCPVCAKPVKLDFINAHIDKGCPSPISSDSEEPHHRGNQKNEWSKLFHNKTKSKEKDHEWEPLPKVSYHPLKDKQVKDILNRHQLPTTGDRNMWIARHERWVILWNANLDRSQDQQKTIGELRLDLKNWEETRKGKKPVPISDNVAYQKANKAQFDHLIAAARPKKAPDKCEELQSEKDSHEGSTSTAAEDEVIIVDSD